MTNFTLKVNFTQDQLNLIYASGSNVVLGKSDNGLSPQVAWTVFRPIVQNQVSWDSDYGVYASNTQLQPGARLVMMSVVPQAQTGQLFTIEPSGNISGPSGPGAQGQYSILDQFQSLPQLTTGVTQDIQVNGQPMRTPPVLARAIFNGTQQSFKPTDPVFIWLQSNVVSGQVLGSATSTQTLLDFTSSNTNISVSYDSATGRFIPNNNATNVSHIEPAL